MSSLVRNALCIPCQQILHTPITQPEIVITKDWKISPETLHLLRDPAQGSQIALLYAANQNISEFDLKVGYEFSARLQQSQSEKCHIVTLHLVQNQENCDVENERSLFEGQLGSSNTGSELTWATIINWLRNCIDNHKLCKSPNPPGKIAPARLIDVGVAEDFSDVRLCLTDKVPAETIYIALSHCRGKTEMLELKTASLVMFKERILFSSLSKTHQHAIIATRKLRRHFGVRYIWIDSLCIVQDSQHDWAQESKKMGEIYKNAFCVIAATAGMDGRSGLFLDRHPLSICPVIIEAEIGGLPRRTYTCENRRAWESEIDQSSLLRRAWVTQERTLAKRVLHFSAYQTYFECISMEASEVHVHQIPEYPRLNRKIWSADDFKQKRGFGKLYDPRKADFYMYDAWDGVRHLYSRCSLTRASDKLIAVSGIAREMYKHMKDEDVYIAGLWKRFLVNQLLWEVRPDMHKSRPEEYRAPTWSWASVDAPLLPQLRKDYENERTSMVTISSVDVTNVDNDPFFTVMSATLRLSGHLIKATMFLNQAKGLHRTKIVMNGSGVTIGKATTDTDILLEDPGDNHTFCMPLLYEMSGEVTKSSSPYKIIHGLLLRKTLKSRGQYKRCGIFRTSEKSEQEQFMECTKSPGLKEDDYEEITEQGLYKISIV